MNRHPHGLYMRGGLHETLGLSWRDGWLYATQRPEVTRMKDRDGDGRADVFETVAMTGVSTGTTMNMRSVPGTIKTEIFG